MLWSTSTDHHVTQFVWTIEMYINRQSNHMNMTGAESEDITCSEEIVHISLRKTIELCESY
jgi:hypothetical protein